MSAIEDCRTAALGGHVARCENEVCGFTSIAYNSCLMGKSSNCRRSETPRSQDWHHRRAAHLGLGDDVSPARAHDRAGRRHPTWWRSLDRSAAQLLPAGAGALQAVPAADAGEACCCARGQQAQVLRHARGTRRCCAFRRVPGSAQKQALVRLRQGALRGAESRARLPVALHPPRRHLQQSALEDRRQDGDLPRQELSCRWLCAIYDDDARRRRVHPPNSFSTCCRRGSIASAITACSPTAHASRTSRSHASCSA